MMAVERTAALISDLYRLPLSTGTVMNMINEAAEVLTPTVERIATAITQAAAAGADETGRRVAGKRGREAINYIPLLKGILGHDGWKPYRITHCAIIRCTGPTTK